MGSISDIKKYALEKNVPIMMDDGIEFLKDYISKNNVKKILEIGTAIGYSSICMASVCDDVYITTIERDEKMYKKAIENVNDFNLNDRIKLVFGDALYTSSSDKYDLIFIDGAKAQSIKFFERYEGNLNDNGCIITDNLNFHGLTDDVDNIKSKNLRALVKKINNYKDYLKNNEKYVTKFYNIGDGISVSKKK